MLLRGYNLSPFLERVAGCMTVQGVAQWYGKYKQGQSQGMRAGRQLLTIAAIGLIALPLSARFVPGTRPAIDRIGLLQPFTAAGIVPADAAEGGEARGGFGGGPTKVIASAVQHLPLRDVIVAIGSARGVQSVEMSFGIGGRLSAVNVAAGDRVAAGDVIAELDAEAAGLAVERARLIVEDARKTLERLERLAKSGATAATQSQDAELALRTAELGLQTAESDLANHRLAAPVAGYVGLIGPQIGDLVSPSIPVTRIEDRSSLIVDFQVPERVAAAVTAGTIIEASAISGAEQPLRGRVVAVDNRVDETSRSLRVQAEIPNADDRLRAGMAFRVTIVFMGAELPAVDPLAIQWGADGAFVWVVRGGKAARVPIRILQRNTDVVLVDATFESGDLVVTEGVQALRPDADVTPVTGGS